MLQDDYTSYPNLLNMYSSYSNGVMCKKLILKEWSYSAESNSLKWDKKASLCRIAHNTQGNKKTNPIKYSHYYKVFENNNRPSQKPIILWLILPFPNASSKLSSHRQSTNPCQNLHRQFLFPQPENHCQFQ